MAISHLDDKPLSHWPPLSKFSFPVQYEPSSWTPCQSIRWSSGRSCCCTCHSWPNNCSRSHLIKYDHIPIYMHVYLSYKHIIISLYILYIIYMHVNLYIISSWSCKGSCQRAIYFYATVPMKDMQKGSNSAAKATLPSHASCSRRPPPWCTPLATFQWKSPRPLISSGNITTPMALWCLTGYYEKEGKGC